MNSKLGSRLNISLLFIYLIPVVVLLWFVASFGVNVPAWDQWKLVAVFDKVATGKASFTDFFALHNEHRLVFPKLIFLSLAFLTKWDIRYELYLSIFLAGINFLILYKISSLSRNNNTDSSWHLANILTCILIFSLVQYENWLWGFQVAWLLINTCFTLAVLIIATSKNSARLYLAAIPCLIASFSSAQGLLTWLAAIPLIASVHGSFRQRGIRVVGWILLFAVTSFIYLIGYVKPSYHPSTLFFLTHPLIGLEYLFTLLGTPLSNQPLTAIVVGLVILLSFLYLTLNFLKKSQYIQIDSTAAPWISIGLFTLLFALMTTAGRAGFGVEQATASRYTTSAILLIISVIHLSRLFFSTNNFNFIAGIIAGLIFTNSFHTIPQASLEQIQKQSNTTCLELFNFIEPTLDSCLTKLYPFPNEMKEMVEGLERVGFRRFPKNLAFNTQPDKVHGYIDSPPTVATPTTINKSGSLNLGGWAVLRDSQEQPKLVLLSYGNQKSFFASAVVNQDSPDVAKALKSNRYNKVRWSVNISPKSLPLGVTALKAWVYNPATQQLIQLSGEPKIKVVE